MRDRSLGILAVLASAVFFALATVGVKYATITGEASAVHVSMARFLIGLCITVPMMVRKPQLLRPRSVLWVSLRAAANVAAVFLFFFGIQLTTVSKANLLNMTYPIFVFALSPFVTHERAKPITVGLLAVTMILTSSADAAATYLSSRVVSSSWSLRSKLRVSTIATDPRRSYPLKSRRRLASGSEFTRA